MHYRTHNLAKQPMSDSQAVQVRMRRALALIDPADLRFHAKRYESADMLRTLVRACRSKDPLDVESEVCLIADVCIADGGEWGHIPCLGGKANDVWLACLAAWGTGDCTDLDRVIAEHGHHEALDT